MQGPSYLALRQGLLGVHQQPLIGHHKNTTFGVKVPRGILTPKIRAGHQELEESHWK
jgi:hypothetical protein